MCTNHGLGSDGLGRHGLGRINESFYRWPFDGACVAMGMNIKDPEVHAMARQLAARRGTSVTDAVRQALRAALEREPDLVDPLALQAKREAIEHICQRFRDLPLRDGRRPQELCNDLYDAQGLPV